MTCLSEKQKKMMDGYTLHKVVCVENSGEFSLYFEFNKGNNFAEGIVLYYKKGEGMFETLETTQKIVPVLIEYAQCKEEERALEWAQSGRMP